jgi:hypothetical protein
VKLALQQIMSDVDSKRGAPASSSPGPNSSAVGLDDGNGDEEQVIGTLVCFRDFYTPDTIDDLASGADLEHTDTSGADTRAQLLELIQEAMPEFLTCTFGPTSNFRVRPSACGFHSFVTLHAASSLPRLEVAPSMPRRCWRFDVLTHVAHSYQNVLLRLPSDSPSGSQSSSTA